MLTLYRTDTAKVTGVVLNPDGSPCPRAFVSGNFDRELVDPGIVPPMGGMTNGEGKFSLKHVFPDVPLVVYYMDSERGVGGFANALPTLDHPVEGDDSPAPSRARDQAECSSRTARQRPRRT